MKAIYKAPHKEAEVIDIDNTLEALQAAVGGPIETVTFSADACILCNEEGRWTAEPFNCTLLGLQLFGPVLICGVKGDEFTSLRKPETAMRLFGWAYR